MGVHLQASNSGIRIYTPITVDSVEYNKVIKSGLLNNLEVDLTVKSQTTNKQVAAKSTVAIELSIMINSPLEFEALELARGHLIKIAQNFLKMVEGAAAIRDILES